MKRAFVFAAAIVLSASVALASVKPGDKSELKVDTKASKVYWTGKKVTGEHTGYVVIGDGSVVLKDGKLDGGVINMDMTTIESTDMQGEWKDKLVGHLKSDDFFSVEKHPVATLKVKSVKASGAKSVVTGDLTIKGITHEVEFPVETKVVDGTLIASGTAVLDRTKWDIRFRSGKFFTDLGDNLIYDEFEIKFDLVAKSAEELTSL
ncbi:YceI family protein [Maribellus sediminis]|uniref:YceI family protein n=1 Tax=Maribellus sediminis TaxID=2696285 RepID=UPI0014321A04|nr:YceI family protein [Maribellus sediminis]